MSLNAAVLATVTILISAPAWSQEDATLAKRIDRLESDIRTLHARIDDLGPASALRDVRVVDPVFIGAGGAKTNSLAMDNAAINCPPHSFVTAVQILKTGNTVSQIRYACRGVE